MLNATLWRLWVFRTVVEHGGITPAARFLDISQPSVSQHVRALEQEFGQQLLDRRRGRKAQPTNAGRVLHAYARDVTVGADDVGRIFAELSGGSRGAVSAAVSRTLANHILAPSLIAFARDHPRVDVTVRTDTLSQVCAYVRSGAVDFGLLLSRGGIEDLASDVVARESLVVVAAPEHPLARESAVTAATLALTPFVCGLRSSNQFAMVDACLAEAGIRDYPVAIEVEDSATIKDVVRRGFGIAALVGCCVREEVRRGILAEIHPVRPLPRLDVRTVHLPRKRFGPAAAALLRSVRQGASAMQPAYV